MNGKTKYYVFLKSTIKSYNSSPKTVNNISKILLNIYNKEQKNSTKNDIANHLSMDKRKKIIRINRYSRKNGRGSYTIAEL